MNPSEIIAEVAKLGVALRVEGANLVHRGPRGALRPEHIAKLKAYKPAIIAELTSANALAALCFAADRPALAEAGYGSWQALGDAHPRHVAAALNALPQPTDQKGLRLIAETRHFLGSNWFRQALKCGWTLEGLFGVDALAPLERPEQWGLVVGLALAPKPSDMIERLDAEHAVIRYRVGSLKEVRRIEQRFVPADSSVPWWKCSALVSEAEWFTQLSEPR